MLRGTGAAANCGRMRDRRGEPNTSGELSLGPEAEELLTHMRVFIELVDRDKSCRVGKVTSRPRTNLSTQADFSTSASVIMYQLKRQQETRPCVQPAKLPERSESATAPRQCCSSA